jgi:hypothetical protein
MRSSHSKEPPLPPAEVFFRPCTGTLITGPLASGFTGTRLTGVKSPTSPTPLSLTAPCAVIRPWFEQRHFTSSIGYNQISPFLCFWIAPLASFFKALIPQRASRIGKRPGTVLPEAFEIHNNWRIISGCNRSFQSPLFYPTVTNVL